MRFTFRRLLRSSRIRVLGIAIVTTLALSTAPIAVASSSPAGSDTSQGLTSALAALSSLKGGDHRPSGMALTPTRAVRAATLDPRVRKWLAKYPRWTPEIVAEPPLHRWHIVFEGATTSKSFFVDVGDPSRQVLAIGAMQAWTSQLGLVGKIMVRPYVWLVFCALFLIPFLDPRRPKRLLHFDLLALIAFTVSHEFAKRGNNSLSVDLVYPVLLYLLGRMVWAGFRPRARAGKLVPLIPVTWLIVGIVALTGAKIAINVADSSVTDVGLAGVVGAHQIDHGHGPYDGGVQKVILGGQTYGPVTYIAYTPFETAFPPNIARLNSPVGNYTADRAATIAFDLLTLLGLFLLGRVLRPGRGGREMGISLAFAWASFPYSAFVIATNTNDSLVAALLVFSLVAIASPRGRGVLLALASCAKFFPLALVPLFASGLGSRRLRTWLVFGTAFLVTAAVCTLPFIPAGGLRALYHETIGQQINRYSPLSIWGLHPGLNPFKHVVQGITVCFALGLAFWPRKRSAGQVAALTAAVVILIQLTLGYWYYFYIVWFAPAVMAALFAEYGALSRSRRAQSRPAVEELVDEPAALEPAALSV